MHNSNELYIVILTCLCSQLKFNLTVRSMLDMHRANSNQLKIETTKVDVLRDILEPVAAMIYRRGATFEVLVDCPEHLLIESDPLRLKQVVLVSLFL